MARWNEERSNTCRSNNTGTDRVPDLFPPVRITTGRSPLRLYTNAQWDHASSTLKRQQQQACLLQRTSNDMNLTARRKVDIRLHRRHLDHACELSPSYTSLGAATGAPGHWRTPQRADGKKRVPAGHRATYR